MPDRRGRRPQFGLAVDAENRPRRRADDAIDGEPVARLQAPNCRLGLGPEFAIGGQLQRGLQASDRAAAGA